MRCWIQLAVVIAVVMGCLSSPALAQTSRPASRPADQPAPAAAPTGLLAGPKVEPEALDMTPAPFGAGPVRGQRELVIRPRRWIELYRTLQLDDSQMSKMNRVLKEFRGRIRRFARDHDDEVRELRGIRKTFRDGNGLRDLSEEQVARLRELEAKRPDPVPYQMQLWEQLDETQRDAFWLLLDQERKRMSQQRRARLQGKQSAKTDG